MILTIFAIACMTPETPSWTPVQFLDSNKYEVLGTPPHRDWITFKRKEDMVNVSFDVNESNPQYASKPILIAAYNGPPRVMPSGIPLGRQVLAGITPGILSFSVVANWEQARIGLQAPRQARSAPTPFRPDDFSDERASCELLLRQVLASYASRRLSTGGSITLAGQSVNSWRASKSNATLVDVVETARELGITLNTNTSAGRTTFSLGGVARLMALGSDKMKVGTQWRDISDLVMLKNGKWLAPKEVFQ